MIDEEKRKNFAKEVFKKYPDKIAVHLQEKILAQQVVLGMDPYMAHLAAGAFVFRVEADPAVWSKDADPYKVMWAQSTRPDASKIWMTFETAAQYPEEGESKFMVVFEKGKAIEINRLGNQK